MCVNKKNADKKPKEKKRQNYIISWTPRSALYSFSIPDRNRTKQTQTYRGIPSVLYVYLYKHIPINIYMVSVE